MIRGRKGGKEEERGQDMGRKKESRKLLVHCLSNAAKREAT